MNTPICDFIENYIKSDAVRLHMPGHKGKSLLGFENADITEISGADSLFEAKGIIAESERNTSLLFGSDTFYSTEGSSLSIRAMLYLFRLWAGENSRVIAVRNCHKAFLTAAALLDLRVDWIYPKKGCSYLSCDFDISELEEALKAENTKTAVYITSPDYLGGMADLGAISEICKKYGAKLLVDNAHGAYLKFLPESKHPMNLGASMCCDSAHKTLPVLTGGAYLHISKGEDEFFKIRAKDAMSLFASTSPSYLILQSLDKANEYIDKGYKNALRDTTEKIAKLREDISQLGLETFGSEPLKITILPKSFGYSGFEIAEFLKERNIHIEFADKDALVLMFTAENIGNDIERLISALKEIPRKCPVKETAPIIGKPKRALSLRSAVFSETEVIPSKDSLGRVFAELSISCPPAVPIAVCGEVIDENIINAFEYYGITKCRVIKNI